jgi:hypothetical protein
MFGWKVKMNCSHWLNVSSVLLKWSAVVMEYNIKVHNCNISTSPVLLCVMVLVRVTDLLLYNVHTSNIRVELVAQEERREHGQMHRRWIYTTMRKKKLYEHSPSIAWFPCYGLLNIKENVQIVNLEFPFRHCRRLTFGTLLSFTTSDWGCLPWFPMKPLSRAAARCASAD